MAKSTELSSLLRLLHTGDTSPVEAAGLNLINPWEAVQ